MKHQLEGLKVTDLVNLEAGQLLKRHLTDMANQPVAIVDVPLQNYVTGLNDRMVKYEQSLVQNPKSEFTDKITDADDIRDAAISSLKKAHGVFITSDDAAEVDAATGLTIVFNVYKGLADKNYEAETLGIDRLIADLSSAVNAPKVATLQLQRYVDRLRNSNEAFKTISGNRLNADATTEWYDTKTLRIDLFKYYSEFTKYVVAMANATDAPEFTDLLALLNTTRKYYADMLAKRGGKNKASNADTITPPVAPTK